jgi:flagellar basal-body rod protein FlgB
LAACRTGKAMIEALFNQPNYVAAKRMLDATVLRHEALTSNINHLETPNYKRIDVAPSFHSELRQALAAGDSQRLAQVRPRLHVDPQAVARNRDGNTVQLEQELAEMGKNMLEHSLETQLITGRLLRLRLAITGRSS